MQLVDFVLDRPANIVDMHFMLQKEMAERLSAVPGGKAWGRLSMTQVTLNVRYLFGGQSFRPPPKVDSSIIRLTPKQDTTLPVARRVWIGYCVWRLPVAVNVCQMLSKH